jgi:outer membrane protein
MKKSISIILLLTAIASADAPPTPTGPTTSSTAGQAGALVLTLQQALDIAARQQPSLRQSKATAEAAAARVDQSKVILHPTASLGASLGTGSKSPHSCIAADGTVSTCGGGFFTAGLSTGLSAQASWRIYDFGLTAANIRAAEASAVAAAAGIDTTVLDIRKSVESAYFEAVARARLIKVAEATVASEEGHLDQAKRFVAAQAKDPIEVAQAQARAANARSALAQAHSNEAVALANLRAAIGWIDATHSPVVEGSWPEPPTDLPELTAMVETSRKNRPEIVQLDKQILAADASLSAAHLEQRPILSASAQTAWAPNDNDWSPQPTWTAGISLTWPILDGGKSKADVRLANANLAGAVAARDALLVSLTSELDSARAQIVANRANVQASTEAVDAAKSQLHLADGRYAQGLGSQIELADAQTAVTTAEGNLVLAEYELADAWAQLRRALGQI